MSKKNIILVLIVLILASALAACGVDKTKPGSAVNLTGDPVAGKAVFTANCAKCHGDEGKSGISNPGSADETVPGLNPIDPGFNTVESMDLVIQHGSEPEGNAPSLQMAAYGDKNLLTQQQIADVIAYVLSLNK